MKFALIGIRYSNYFKSLLEKLIDSGIRPYYVIIEDTDKSNLGNGAYFIDNMIFETYSYNVWNYDQNHSSCVIESCIRHKIPFFIVCGHNNWRTVKILNNFTIDILLITEGPLIRGDILYKPQICAMNIHAAPLPGYRGNWTTRIALYNDEPPMVSAHVVTPWIDQGPIIGRREYKIEKGDCLADIDRKAVSAAIELACDTLRKIQSEGFNAVPQRLWEGKEYKGSFKNGVLQPAMPIELQEELEKRFLRGEYGFFS